MIIPGGQIGELARKGKIVEKQYQPIDTDTLEYCWQHQLELTSDWKHPNEVDKKKLEEIRLVEGETQNKDGTWTKFRWCRKCGNMVYYTKQPK